MASSIHTDSAEISNRAVLAQCRIAERCRGGFPAFICLLASGASRSCPSREDPLLPVSLTMNPPSKTLEGDERSVPAAIFIDTNHQQGGLCTNSEIKTAILLTPNLPQYHQQPEIAESSLLYGPHQLCKQIHRILTSNHGRRHLKSIIPTAKRLSTSPKVFQIRKYPHTHESQQRTRRLQRKTINFIKPKTERIQTQVATDLHPGSFSTKLKIIYQNTIFEYINKSSWIPKADPVNFTNKP